jgi:hypothetical protein
VRFSQQLLHPDMRVVCVDAGSLRLSAHSRNELENELNNGEPS